MNKVSIEIISGLGGKDPAAILVVTKTHHILLDAGGVLEQDAPLWEMPSRIDAVLLSHDHFDHIGNVANLPSGVPIYCSQVTAETLESQETLNLHIIPIRGEFYLGDTRIITGANGHAFGGMWFHLDCAGGLFFSGDISLESLLYRFDPPPKARIALLDASYGRYNISQEQLRLALSDVLDQSILFPVPPSGRAVEMALWLSEMGQEEIGMDHESLQMLTTMIRSNDGSLQPAVIKRLEALAPQLIDVTSLLLEQDGNNGSKGLPPIILAGDPDGVQGISGQLRRLPEFSHRTIFTGYCDAKAREELLRGEVDFMRWNVHPTLDSLQKLIGVLGCCDVVPLFTSIDDISLWEMALGTTIHINSLVLDETNALQKQGLEDLLCKRNLGNAITE